MRAFWRAGVEAGYEDDGEPGPRPQYTPAYFGGFLRDPDGNSAEAVYLEDAHRRGQIDHVWIRVADVAAARDFYAAIAPYAGIHLNHDTPERAQFQFPDGSFSLVPGTPTENVHLAFGTDDDAAVEGVPRHRDRARVRRQRRAGRAARVPPGLLRGVRPGPGRQQRRARQPPPLMPDEATHQISPAGYAALEAELDELETRDGARSPSGSRPRASGAT